MYLDYYGLTEPPFLLTPDPKFLYLSKAHSRAMTFMEYAIANRDGFVVITGEIGAGKTTLISKILNSIDEDTIVARIYHTHIESIEFFQALLEEFGEKSTGETKVALLKQINHYLIKSYAQNKKIILLIDEAQNLSVNLLEEIRLLTDLETNNEKLMNLILVGQPELGATLDLSRLEQLAQRIRFRFHIGSLSEEEMENYISHRLHVAGSKKNLFESSSIPVLYKYTGGIPRLVNTLCDVCLICGYVEKRNAIDGSIVDIAVKELEWKTFAERHTNIDNDVSVLKQNEILNLDTKILSDKLANIANEQHRFFEEIKNFIQRIDIKIDSFQEKVISLENELEYIKKKK